MVLIGIVVLAAVVVFFMSKDTKVLDAIVTLLVGSFVALIVGSFLTLASFTQDKTVEVKQLKGISITNVDGTDNYLFDTGGPSYWSIPKSKVTLESGQNTVTITTYRSNNIWIPFDRNTSYVVGLKLFGLDDGDLTMLD